MMFENETLQSIWPLNSKGGSKENLRVSETEVLGEDSSSNASSYDSGSSTNSPRLATNRLTVHSPLPNLTGAHMYANGLPHAPVKTLGTDILILKETVTFLSMQCKKQFDAKVADEILTHTPTLHGFLDFIAAERLRSMPHKGSKWDKVLKWAESLARKLDFYEQSVRGLFSDGSEAARLFFGACRVLLQLGPKYNEILEVLFGVLYQMGQTMDFFLRNRGLFGASLQTRRPLAAAYADLLRLTMEVAMYYKRNIGTVTIVDSVEFDVRFGRTVDSFFENKECFSSAVWEASLTNSGFGGSSVSIQTIRRWLAPQDRTLELFLSDRLGTRMARYEFTCEWFEIPLNSFQKSATEDVFIVTGGAGSGKSVLCGYLLEHLRKSRRSHHEAPCDVISFTVDGNVKSQRSSANVAQGLLLQLLELNVGSVPLYKLLSAVYQRTEVDGLEDALWTAYDTALDQLHERRPSKGSRRLVIVIDGLDQLKGGDASAKKLYERLHQSAKKHAAVKCILLSRPLTHLPQSESSIGVRTISLDSGSRNSNDIRAFIEHSILHSKELMNLKKEDRESIVQRMLKGSNGSFLWVDLSLQLIRQENTLAGILKALDGQNSLADLLHHISSRVNLKQSSDAKLLVSWLLVTQRPLTVREVKCLFEVDINSVSCSPRLTDIEEDIHKACGSLVVIRDGIVRFSHLAVKEYLLKAARSGELGISMKDAHTHIVTRSLAYLKICFKEEDPEPSFQFCGWGRSAKKSEKPAKDLPLDKLMEKHHFLEYATRYWTTHFQKSAMYNASSATKFTITTEFRACFPESALVTMLEASWWERQSSAITAVHMHSLALELRKLVFAKSVNRALVQCYMNVAVIREKVSSTSTESYLEAWSTSRTVLGEHSTVVMTCAEAYLTSAETVSKTTKSTVTTTSITKKVTKYMFKAYKHVHGEAHELTIKYAKSLASLYLKLEKTEKAIALTREVHAVCIKTYGYTHKETIEMSSQLTTILQKVSRTEECIEIQRSVLTVVEKTTEVWEKQHISTTISMVEIYEKSEQIKEAEGLLISLRESITKVCKSKKEDHVYEAKIEITIQHVRFLKRHTRTEEANKLLVSLWDEFKSLLDSKEDHSETLLIRIRTIGEEMKSVTSMRSWAESVYSSLWGFYKKVGRQTSTEATTIAIELSRVSKESSTIQETLTEVFTKSLTTKNTVEITTVNTCIELSSFYEREERWTEAIEVCSTVLVKLWPSVVKKSEGSVCYLPSTHRDKAIEIAYRFAICHHKDGRVEEAEVVYTQIFHACKSTLHLHDKIVLRTAQTLVEFYESVGMIEKATKFYEELHSEYLQVLGASHSVTVQITYRLARFCERHHPRKAEVFYLEIIECHGKKTTEECDLQSIEACLALCRIYEHDRKLKEAQKLYRSVWLTFVNRGECGLSTEEILEVHRKYILILETEKSEFSIIQQITVQFKEACVRHFGIHHQVTIEATIQLAKVLERHEEHHAEAIRIYEDVVAITSEKSTTTTTTTTTTTVSETVITEVRKRLAQLYSSHSETKTKAEVIYYQSWEESLHQYGYSHTESIERLSQLICFFKKMNTKECIHTATETLHTTVIEVIRSTTNTEKLFGAGQAISRLYLDLGLKEVAFGFIGEIRKLITRTSRKEDKSSTTFKFISRLEGHTLDRRCLVLVMAFEEALQGNLSASLYSAIMDDLITETTLFESWMRERRYYGGFESTVRAGSRLAVFLRGKGRQAECEQITDELWQIFREEVKEDSEKKSGHVWELFQNCIVEMGKEEDHCTILEAATTAVTSCYKKGNFLGAFELTQWIHRYVVKSGGYAEQRNLTIGFKLALLMAGCSTAANWKRCQDTKTNELMAKLSSEILKEVLKCSEGEHLSFSKMSLEDVNAIVGILGKHRNFQDLERILRDLWEARQTRNSWGVDIIVGIGCRLCQVLFAHGRKDEAVALSEDIWYNLRRVWGPLDTTTLSCFNLLTSLYTERKQFDKAMQRHEEMLQQVLAEDEITAHTAVTAAQQLRHLESTFRRLGKWDENGEAHYEKLWNELKERIVEAGYKDMLSGINGVKSWSKKGANPAEDALGKWEEPRNWEFMEEAKRLSGIRHHACHQSYDIDEF